MIHQQGNLSGALDSHRQALIATDTALGPLSYLSSRNQETIAVTLWKMNRRKEACDQLHQALVTDKVVARGAAFVRACLRGYRRTCEVTGVALSQQHEQTFCDRLKEYLIGPSQRFPDPTRPQNLVFFDYLGHTRLLTQTATWETVMGHAPRALSR